MLAATGAVAEVLLASGCGSTQGQAGSGLGADASSGGSAEGSDAAGAASGTSDASNGSADAGSDAGDESDAGSDVDGGADADGGTDTGDGSDTPASAWEIAPEGSVSDATIARLGEDALFVQEPVPDDVFARMEGHSFKDDGKIARDTLRYLRILHRDADGNKFEGEMVTNASISDDVLRIFRELYDADFHIERMRLVDDYYTAKAASAYDEVSNEADTASMADNNTSCFNYRLITGASTVSNHATGTAVDVNTLYNPYVMLYKHEVLPANGKQYVDRSIVTPYTISDDGTCVSIFKKYGFSWGGDWSNVKDYQHFERPQN